MVALRFRGQEAEDHDSVDYGYGSEDDLPGDAVVIRTGPMTDQNLGRNADLNERHDPGLWAISVQSHPTMTEEEIAWAMDVKGKSMNVTTAGAIRRDEGFKVVPDTKYGPVHALILLGGPPADHPGIWDEIRARFPVKDKPNPAYGKSSIYGGNN